jgi:hypothetical protein
MTQSRNDEERVWVLIALGSLPGVSAWFSAWLLARSESRAKAQCPAPRFANYLCGLR